MTLTKTIESAREMLRSGNAGAYARVMSAAIRSAASDRAENTIRKAISEDRAELHFAGLATSTPVAA